MLDPVSLVIGIAAGAAIARLAASLVARSSQLTSSAAARLAPDQVIARLKRALTRARTDIARRDESLSEFRNAYEQRARELDEMRRDVRDAVKLTRDLRAELIEQVHQRVTDEHRQAAANER